MSGIQSSIGLISGIDTDKIVRQLLQIAARPRDALVSRVQRVAQQQGAITDLTTLVIGLELAAKRLGGENSVFSSVRVKSSNAEAVSASSSGKPQIGSYSLTPVRKAQTNQLLSSRFATADTPLGAGSISFQKGGFVTQAVELDSLNGGQGVDRGKIRITDRGGNSGVVDLRYAKTTEDVIDAINQQTEVNVTAELDGDRIKLVDNTGQTAANLKVQNVGTDSTATDLGLAGIDVAANTATGSDIFSLSRNTLLSALNNGNGIDFTAGAEALSIALADEGAAVSIDLAGSKSVGDVLDRINAADPTRVQAQVSASGDSIEIIDLTTGAGTLEVSSGTGTSAAEDLGIAGTSAGSTLTGTRIAAGLDTVLLSRLNGGQGLGELGNLSITDRAGNSATIDLSSAQTLDEVLASINAASGISVTASVNKTGNGFTITDSSGGFGDLVIADDADGLTTATKLQIEGSFSANIANSEPLNLQSVSRNTKLSDFRGGVPKGSFLISDTNGATSAINLTVLGAETIGDVLDAINSLAIGVSAEINDEGNGIKLVDTAGGSGAITVAEAGNGLAAKGLGLVGTSTEVNGVQTLSGSQRTTIEIAEDDTLDSLIEKINDSDAGVRAAKFFDGVGYRLNLISETPGGAGQIWIDSTLENSFEVVAKGQDSLLQYGPPGSQASLLLSSNTDTFSEIIPDVEFTINQAGQEEVLIKVERNDTAVSEAVKLFVDQFNKITAKVNEMTKFSSTTTATGTNITTGLLFGSSEALQIEQELTRLATGTISKAGEFTNLRQIGITYSFESETLEFDETKFKEAFAEDPTAVAAFFETEDNGVSDRFQAVADRLAGVDNSILLNRNNALQRKIETFNERIDLKTERLSTYEARLRNQFFKMEETLSRIQQNQTSLGSIQYIPPVGSR